MSEPHPPQDAPISLSDRLALPYTITLRDWMDLRVTVTRMDAKIDTALALHGRVDAIEKRVADLELVDARASGRTGAWDLALDRAWNLLFAIVAGGLGYFLGAN